MTRTQLERHHVWVYVGAILIGLVVGTAAPVLGPVFEPMLWPALGILLYGTFAQVPRIHLPDAFRDVRFMGAVLAGNSCLSRFKGQQAVRELSAMGGEYRFDRVDLASLASIADFAARWGERPIHLLVNVAGVTAVPERTRTADGFEMHMGTNFLGHFALTGRVASAERPLANTSHTDLLQADPGQPTCGTLNSGKNQNS